MRRLAALFTLVLLFILTQKISWQKESRAPKVLTPAAAPRPAGPQASVQIQVQAKRPKERRPAQALQAPSDLSSTFSPHPSISMPGFVLAKDVGVLPKTRWRESMGEKIWEDGHNVFFRKEGPEGTPAAFSRSRGKFYPVSSVINIKGVSEDLRQGLLNEGFQEYHYLPRMKLLFLQTPSQETLKIYEELKARGLKVKLEVLDERPQAH